MRKKTEICIVCNLNKPQKGRVCEKCRYILRKDYYQNRNRKYNETHSRKRKYREERLKIANNKCEKCGWNMVKSVLNVHHIDRNRTNNKLENLIILCPNCHSIEHYNKKTGLYTNHRC